jgi:hypothetical protein
MNDPDLLGRLNDQLEPACSIEVIQAAEAEGNKKKNLQHRANMVLLFEAAAQKLTTFNGGTFTSYKRVKSLQSCLSNLASRCPWPRQRRMKWKKCWKKPLGSKHSIIDIFLLVLQTQQ